MLRTVTIALVSGLLAASAQAKIACPASNYEVGNVSMDASGIVSRRVFVASKTESQRGKADVQYVPVVRDRIELGTGDMALLNASPEMRDSMLQVEVKERSQERDSQGIFSTTYAVKEIMTPMFAGKAQKAIVRASFVTVKSNYLGKGTYSKDCGEVIKTDLDFETDADAAQ